MLAYIGYKFIYLFIIASEVQTHVKTCARLMSAYNVNIQNTNVILYIPYYSENNTVTQTCPSTSGNP